MERLAPLLLDQAAFGLKQKLKMDHRFHRAPLVLDCLEPVQDILPSAACGAAGYLPNEIQDFICAAQYSVRAPADTQLRIDRKIGHASTQIVAPRSQ